MRSKNLIVFALLVFLSCKEEIKQTKNVMVTGNIKGFTKGKLYIQRIKDTILVPIDSIMINGNAAFTTQFDITEPEMLYLYIDRGVTNSVDNNIPFFAEKGKIHIETSSDYFTADAKITGSKNQALYDEYKKVMSRFIDTDLELIKSRVEALKNKNTIEAENIMKAQQNNIKRKYLYTTNFAVNNGKYEVAPYVTLAEIYDINLKYLDTIQKSMSPEVAKSLYGKKLNQLVLERKKIEK
jgi:gas vesicle protein